MKITGIIAEYNPFHNGHLYQLEQIRSNTDTDYIVVVMNGDFTQRGEAAMLNKYIRARQALLAGVDLVIELPVLYGTGSAEYFAEGAVKLLHSLGCIDTLCFGCESEDLSLLRQIAKLLTAEDDVYRSELKLQLKAGNSYPKARTLALIKSASERQLSLPEDLSILQQPNTILAIEYLKALTCYSDTIEPYIIRRKASSYHSTELSSCSSASAVRTIYETKGPVEDLKQALPSHVYDDLFQEYKRSAPMKTEFFYPYIQFCLWQNQQPLSEYLDISEDLANRIHTVYSPSQTYQELVEAILNKQYTATRIQRSLLHLLLGITAHDMELQRESKSIHYARVLGFRRNSSALLRQIRSCTSIPIVQQPAKAIEQFRFNNIPAYHLLYQDIASAELYEQVCYQQYHHTIHNEYTTGVIMI